MSLLLGITLCFRSCDFDISFSVLKEAGLLAFEVLTVSVVPMQCLWMHSHVLPWWNFETARDLRGGSATMFFLLSMGRSETPRGIWISQANVLFKQTRITNSLIRKTTIQWVRLNAVFYLSACEVWGLFFKLSLAFLVATNSAQSPLTTFVLTNKSRAISWVCTTVCSATFCLWAYFLV